MTEWNDAIDAAIRVASDRAAEHERTDTIVGPSVPGAAIRHVATLLEGLRRGGLPPAPEAARD